jgi:hypothetical protein
MCIFFLLWWIPAEINIGFFCILLSVLAIPKSRIDWRRSINLRELSIIFLVCVNLFSLIINGASGADVFYVVNISIGVYIYLLIVRSKLILKFIGYVYGAWLMGALLHLIFFFVNILQEEDHARNFFSISGDQILKVPNDVVYFIIAFSISITIIKPFIQRKWNSIFISIFTILLIFFSLNFGGRSILIYSLMLAIGIILDTRKNIKNATMVISGVGLIYLFLNYEKYDSAVYRLLNLSPICDGRIPQWLLAFEIGIENFWKGAGSSEFGRQWNNFVLNPVSDSCFYIDTRVISWPHNLLLEQFSFSGIFSLILLMYLLYSIVSFIFKSFKARILDEGLTFHFAVMVYILACLLDLTFYRLWVSVCFFMILYSVEFYFITNYYRRVK